MLSSRRLLAALLCLTAASSNAQVERVGAPSLLTMSVAPAAAGAAPLFSAPALSGFAAPSLSASAAPSLFAPALNAAPAALSAAAPAFSAAPAAAAVISAAAPAALSAAADGRPRGLTGAAAPNDASPSNPGGRLFDGVGNFVTRSGSVFSPTYRSVPVRGAVAFVRVKAAPVAPVKAVPDTQGLSGAALLDRVSNIAARGQTKHEYHEASQYLFSHADNHTLNGVRGVADAYSGVFVPGTSAESSDYSETGDKTHDGWAGAQTMNVEHVFPQSFFRQRQRMNKPQVPMDLQKGLPMRADLHHLMATLEHPNGMRGSYPFGVATGSLDYSNDAGAKRGGNRFEPPDFTKGRVARAMLYFYARYKNEPFFKNSRAVAFWNTQAATMLDWNRRFPPTVEERARNDQVEAFQGNRNPFVDDPGLADRIGLDALASPSAPRASSHDDAWDTIERERVRDSLRYSQLRAAELRRSDQPRKGKKGKYYFPDQTASQRRSDKPRKGGKGKFHRPDGRNRGGFHGR